MTDHDPLLCHMDTFPPFRSQSVVLPLSAIVYRTHTVCPLELCQKLRVIGNLEQNL